MNRAFLLALFTCFVALSFGQIYYSVSGYCIRSDTGEVMVGGWAPGFNPSPGVTTWGFDGVYSVTLPQGYNGVATPHSTYQGSFDPPSRNYTNLNSDLTGENYTFTPLTVSVSGYVTRSDTGAGIPNVSFSNLPGYAITDANGYYHANLISGFTGIVAPVYSYGSFSPPVYYYSNVTTNQYLQNFVWTPTYMTISGTITNAQTGIPIEGVTLLNLPGEPQTDSLGYYSSNVPQGFSGVVRPWQPVAGSFSPVSRGYSNVMQSYTNQDYTWSALTLTISGQVRRSSNNNGLPGVHFIGFPDSVITNASGHYTATVPYGFSGGVFPTYSNYDSFQPFSRVYNNLTSSVTDQNYIWTSTPVTDEIQAISGLSISPNPFTDKASVSFKLERPGPVNLQIFDLKGRLIHVDKRSQQNPGEQVLTWDGSTLDGFSCPAGIYLCRLTCSGLIYTRKLLRLN